MRTIRYRLPGCMMSYPSLKRMIIHLTLRRMILHPRSRSMIYYFWGKSRSCVPPLQAGREVVTQSTLSDRSVVQVYGHFQWYKLKLLILEFVAEGSLLDYLQSAGGKLEEVQAAVVSSACLPDFAWLCSSLFLSLSLSAALSFSLTPSHKRTHTHPHTHTHTHAHTLTHFHTLVVIVHRG